MTVAVVIPVYNEATTIAAILDAIRAVEIPTFEKEIIVVDDGSTDGTGRILDDYAVRHAGTTRLTVIHLPANRGKAAAIRTGLSAAQGEVVLIQDADLEYSPADYHRLLAPFSDPATQVVYGSRFMETRWPTGMKLRYWLANKIFTSLVNLLYHAHLTDEGTGYKLFRREAIMALDLRTQGFRFCPEATCKLLGKGIRITEVPISYRARNSREGKKPRFSDGIAIIATILGCRFGHRWK
jgi:glycosyltransferase involved in cell wall biosynthesis